MHSQLVIIYELWADTNSFLRFSGYMSPEYASDGIFSVKSDVFSFGVVMLETISGKRNSRIFMLEHGLSLLGHVSITRSKVLDFIKIRHHYMLIFCHLGLEIV